MRSVGGCGGRFRGQNVALVSEQFVSVGTAFKFVPPAEPSRHFVKRTLMVGQAVQVRSPLHLAIRMAKPLVGKDECVSLRASKFYPTLAWYKKMLNNSVICGAAGWFTWCYLNLRSAVHTPFGAAHISRMMFL